MQIFIKSPKFTNPNKAHLYVIFQGYLFHKSSKSCQVDYLIYLLNILPKEFGALIIILKGGITVSQTATACRGPHERRRHAQLRAIYFPINNGLCPGRSAWGGFLQTPECSFLPLFVTTVQREKQENREMKCSQMFSVFTECRRGIRQTAAGGRGKCQDGQHALTWSWPPRPQADWQYLACNVREHRHLQLAHDFLLPRMLQI